MQGIATFETLSSDGLCSVMRLPGSAAVLVDALEDAADAGGDNLSVVSPLLSAVTVPTLCYLNDPFLHLPATDEAHSAWCAAVLRAGALPVLRRLMAMGRRGPGAAEFVADAASAASVLPLAAAAPAAATAGGGAGAGGAPEGPAEAAPDVRPDEAPRWRDDPAVATAVGILLGCLTGAPAWGALPF
jgi:hypothetical protein